MKLLSRTALASTQLRPSTYRTFNKTVLAKLQNRSITIKQLDDQRNGRERVVVLGSGWAGYTLSRDLDKRKYQVVVVSPRSYFVFTPLLASTSVGTLEFRTALEPVRSYRANAEFFQGWADRVDFDTKTLTIEAAVEDPWQGRPRTSDRHAGASREQRNQENQSEAKKGQLFDLKWDRLVVAVGCYNQTFNTKGVKENAYFLKDVGDARKIRNRLLSCFEYAALPTTTDEMRQQILNIAVVGGGPTGIEWSAEVHDIIMQDMKRIYPDLIKYAQITVYDVAPRVLGMFDERLSEYAIKHFRRGGISIKTNHHIAELRAGPPSSPKHLEDFKDETTCFTLKLKEEEEIGVGMCVWSTGLMTNPLVENALAGKVKRQPKTGGITINNRLQVLKEDDSGMKDVYALGDCASIEGTSYPATAQVASQEAVWLAKRFNKGDIDRNVFTYKDLGVMAYLGNSAAILQTSGGDISGRVAWLIWRGAYLAKSVSWRNRILIPTYWLINWIFGRDVSRF